MRIGFVGTHSTGKTTLLNYLKTLPSFKDYFINTNISRTLMANGYDINRHSGNDTQLALVSINLDNLLKHQDSISDRTIIDMAAYTKYQYNSGKINDHVYNLINNVCQLSCVYYDIIFYIKPEFELVPDNVRDEDPQYRDDIANIMDDYLYNQNIPIRRLVLLSGTIDERIKQIDDELSSYNL